MKIFKKIYHKLRREIQSFFNKLILIILNIINSDTKYLYLYNYQLIIQKKYKDLLPFNWQEYYKNQGPNFNFITSFNYFRVKYLSEGILFTNVNENTNYGHGFSISKYIQSEIPKGTLIEHGLFLVDHIISQDYYEPFNLILTMSPNRIHRLNQLVEIPPKVIDIGPYIHYAEPFYSKNETKIIKDKLGKTLLFFYTHAIREVNYLIDVDKLIEKLEPIKNMFDSALVSFHFYEIKNRPEILNKFLEANWKIVNFGENLDIYFLERLKSIIELSDLCVGTDMGTHIGYCIHEGKPYHHLDIKIEKTVNEKNISNSKFRTVVIENEKKYKELEKNNIIKEILEPFSKLSLEITEDQKRVIDKYWGSHIRSKEELRKILIESQQSN